MAQTIAQADTRPTVFDHGWGGFSALADRQNWLVVPVSRTRDSGPLENSNFDIALADLGGESDTIEVHRFGHWGPGWYEVIIAAPCHLEKVEEIEAALENYPVLSEEDFSEKEQDMVYQCWENYGASDFRRNLEQLVNPDSLRPELEAAVWSMDSDELWELYRESDVDYWCDDSGAYFELDRALDKLTDTQIAAAAWASYKALKAAVKAKQA